MKKLTAALIQCHLSWEDPQKNRQHLEGLINGISGEIDLFILPEMFTSGFTMNPSEVAETMQGETVSWMKRLASETQAALMGSIVVSDHGEFYNRLLFVQPTGEIACYDKRHTFTLAGEDKVYRAGKDKVIITYKEWKICPQICYDLRFPVWSRNTEDYDLLVYVANWPMQRIQAWDTLLQARAIENMSYCIGVNRVGSDANGHTYSGHSAAYDVLGEKLTAIAPGAEVVQTVELHKKHIHEWREKLQFLEDRDQFSL